MGRKERLASVLERFRKDVSGHQMEVVLDAPEGPHRHLRFRRPESFVFGFDIVTWPGHLAISGDMGADVFSRTRDMFEFFRSEPGVVNERYWIEKVVSGRDGQREFCLDTFRAVTLSVAQDFISFRSQDGRSPEWAEGLIEEVTDLAERLDNHSEHDALVLMDEFESEACPEFKFVDPWDHSLKEYTFHFTWRLHAIVYAINAYDAHHRALEAQTEVTR